MSKLDITVSRDATLNTGNYSSIKPSISLTLKDVDSDKVAEKYEKMSQVLDMLMLLETVTLGNEMDAVQSLGFKKYLTELERVDKETLNDDLIKLFKEI